MLLSFVMQVGWIFTDLVSEDTRKGTVRYSRNKVRGGAGTLADLQLGSRPALAHALGVSAQLVLVVRPNYFQHGVRNQLWRVS